jgi:hypothetical protein
MTACLEIEPVHGPAILHTDAGNRQANICGWQEQHLAASGSGMQQRPPCGGV